jgi:MFS transporter, MHS family, proline/betaine transporter
MTVVTTSGLSRTRALTAALIGNHVEWYEFTVYAFVAATIGQLFFPRADPTTALIASYAVFAGAFFTRPLGGLVFASFGDRFGRRNALAGLLVVVSIATGAIGILPTYAAIGIAAPILLTTCRLIQGFAFGGELAGTSTFILEYAPPGRRGLFTSLIGSTSGVGLIFGALLVLLLQSFLSSDDFRSWGWRVPFVVGFFIAFFGLYMRLKLEDTPAFQTIQQARHVSQAPLIECVTNYFPLILTVFLFNAPQSLYFYLVAAYLPTYLAREAGMSPQTALTMTLVMYAVAVVSCLCVGMLTDRVGRRIPGLITLVLITVTSVPAFMLLNSGSTSLALIGLVDLGIIFGFALSVTGIVFSEIFPARVRYAGSSISSNAAVMLFGGTAPMVSTFLIEQTGNKLAPAIYVTVMAVISLVISYFRLPETSKLPILREEDMKAPTTGDRPAETAPVARSVT